jgi:osmotically-inducible protein OsmY
MNKTDLQLKQDIETELRWDPKVNAARVGVSVDHGAVSLSGDVDTYAQKWAAESATKRVAGVRTVAQDLSVKVLAAHTQSDSDIANAVASALAWNVAVPKSVTATVERGRVVLLGEVRWNFEREAANWAVCYLMGVVSVKNQITVKPHDTASASQVKEGVQAALKRQAITDARSIEVATTGGKVTLTGHASSWRSIEDAANAAWAAPGVTEVDDQLTMKN